MTMKTVTRIQFEIHSLFPSTKLGSLASELACSVASELGACCELELDSVSATQHSIPLAQQKPYSGSGLAQP